MALLATEEKKTTPQTEVTSPTTKPNTTAQGTSAQPSTEYKNTMESLKAVEYSPPSFSSDYDEDISAAYNKIVSREPFKYDFSADPLYGVYQDQYTQMGKQAMRDTMGQAAALTGGYGSSYGQAVGQQQYDAYLQRLNDVLPQLYGMAYDQYADEGAQLRDQLALAEALRSAEYQQFRDDIGDQQYRDAWNLQLAQDRASYGDFGGYEELYGADAAGKMRLAWAAANPDAAYVAGTITADEYYLLTGAQPGAVGESSGNDDPWAYGGAGWNPGYQLEIGGKAPADFWADYYGH